MGRPKSPTQKVRMHIVLDSLLWAECLLLIHDKHYERGFPPGAFSDLVEKALKAYLNPEGTRK